MSTEKMGNTSDQAKSPVVGGIVADRLKSFIERLEHLEIEKIHVQETIKEVFDEARGAGFDVKIMRQILKIRKQDAQEIAEQEELLDLYRHALGMIP